MADYSFTMTSWATTPQTMMASGAALGEILRAGDVVLLYGDLGAGKTTFSRGLVQSLLPEPEEVVSPTFTLVQTYVTSGAILYHYDLYRLEQGDAASLTELGWEESLTDGITLVEWPERLASDYIPKQALFVRITPCPDQSRRIEWSGPAHWQSRLLASPVKLLPDRQPE